NGRGAQQLHDIGVLAEALVRPPPADVLWHGDTRGEGPVHARGADLLGSDQRRFLYQFRAAAAAETDVVREDGRADHVVVAVHRVNAVNDRDAEARSQRALLKAVIHVGPGDQIIARFRVGIAAAE